MWKDVACVLFACVAANHLGLVTAVEEVTGKTFHIVNCPKCATFWASLVCCLSHHAGIVTAAAVSFLAAYAAVWLELFMGFIDKQYEKAYDTIYSTATDDTAAADADKGNTDGSVPDVRTNKPTCASTQD